MADWRDGTPLFAAHALACWKKGLPLPRNTSKQHILLTTLRLMYLDQSKKKEIFERYGKSNTDTGSVESQVALFSYRISHLTEHLKSNHKDYTTARSLTKLVGKRRALLSYLKDRDIERYRALIKALGLRK